MKKRALISVSDKTGLGALAEGLAGLGYELVSTGGSAEAIRAAGLDVTDVSVVTGFPECLGGRVKTLHPAVHAGILARRDEAGDMQFLEEQGIAAVDVVVVNLYPFKATVSHPDCSLAEAVEQIDIGGPTLLRAAAKNYASVVTLCDPADYEAVLAGMQSDSLDLDVRQRLALKVFRHTAAYDALIADWLGTRLPASAGEAFPEQLTLTYEKVQDLRYGENSHQRAAYYREPVPGKGSLAAARQLHGKQLSYNNISDADAALQMVKAFSEPTVVAVKHANPCGIASRDTIEEAWLKAYEADPVSIFGGIVALNRPLTAQVAEGMAGIFLEVVIAPAYEADALEVLSRKKNIRLLELSELARPVRPAEWTARSVLSGLLVQEPDLTVYEPEQIKVVTRQQPTEAELRDCYFGMTVVKFVKSNGIALVRNRQTVGIGPGQVNRITAVDIAVREAGDKAAGAVLASDAFFPFDDCVRAAAAAGVRCIVQPGGSIRDEESIKAADELGLAMVFTGTRHFRH